MNINNAFSKLQLPASDAQNDLSDVITFERAMRLGGVLERKLAIHNRRDSACIK